MQKRFPKNQQKVFLTQLRKLRTDAGMSQVELAKKLGRPQSFVSKIESGERRLDILELRQVCQATGGSLPTFISRLETLLKRG